MSASGGYVTTFKLHRGASAGFVPGPENLISTTIDTGYVDSGPAGSCYKLSAEDVHGNAGAHALVTPGQTTEVPTGSVFAFALEGARPNPATRSRFAVRFTLPNAAPGRLELIDVVGRSVVSRDVGTLGVGRHVVDLGQTGRIRPGLYFVRLTQGANTKTARVTVLE